MKERENEEWRNADITMCGEDMCSEGLTNVVENYILSFGQDQQGESPLMENTPSVLTGDFMCLQERCSQHVMKYAA